MSWLLLQLLWYVPLGLLTARQTKFHLENRIERTNTSARSDREKWQAEKRACNNSMCGYNSGCHGRYPGRVEESWDAGYLWLTITAGVCWPFVIVGWLMGLAINGLCDGVVLTVGPAVKWFFENPKHRKARNLPPQARRAA